MTGKTDKQVETHKENSLISQFPVEITTDILSRLTADSLIRQCKLVCKTWRSLIEDPVFYDVHTRRLLRVLDDCNSPSSDIDAEASVTTDFFLSSLQRRQSASSDYQHSKIFQIGKYISTEMGFHVSKPLNIKKHTNYQYWFIVGSSNGLICLYNANANAISVYNPCMNEYVKLPRPIFKTMYNHQVSMTAGFGYSPYTNEYKVVLMCYKRYQEGTKIEEVNVYTLGTGKWRKAEDIPHLCMVGSLGLFFISGVLLNRAIHWIMRTVPMNADNRNYEIVSFDLTDEKFRTNIVPSPKHGLRNSQLTLLGGCLCVSQKNMDSETMDIWVMNNKDKTWTMKYKIPAKRNLYRIEYFSPISFVGKSKILVCSRMTPIGLYDTETGNIVDNYGLLFTGIIPYKIMSFVSLKALGEDVK